MYLHTLGYEGHEKQARNYNASYLLGMTVILNLIESQDEIIWWW